MRGASAGNNAYKGASTLEILIACAILTLLIAGVIVVSFGSQIVATDTATESEALSKSGRMLENARALSRQDFDLVHSISPTSDGIYQKDLAVVDIDSNTKYVTSNVRWADNTRALAVSLSTLVTNWQNPTDTCNPTASGDWTHPQLLGSVDIGQNNGGTDVAVFKKKAYVTADASSAAKQDFYIVDVANPALSPLPIVASLNTGPGLSAVAVSEKYAYVANMSTVSQLQIINIDPADPQYLHTVNYKVPGNVGTAVGSAVFYSNKKVYLGLTKTPTSAGAAYEFNVIDVATPTSPSFLGGYKTNTLINDIVARNNVAYVATPEPTPSTPQKENLSILDISNPAAGITRINTFTAPNPATMDGESLYLSKDAGTLYLGRSEGGANTAHNKEFFVLDVQNPGAPLPIAQSKYIGSTLNAVTVRENLAFMVTGDTNRGFQIWDLHNLNAAAPYGSLHIQQTSTGGMDCDGNIVYVAQRSNQALQIIGPGN